MRVKDDQLYLNPVLPKNWKAYTFKVTFRQVLITVKVEKGFISLTNESNKYIVVNVCGENRMLKSNSIEELTY